MIFADFALLAQSITSTSITIFKLYERGITMAGSTIQDVYTKAVKDKTFLDSLIADPAEACRDSFPTLSAQDLADLITMLNTTAPISGAAGLKYVNSGFALGKAGTPDPPVWPPPPPWCTPGKQ